MTIVPNITTDWNRLYGTSWKGTIEEDAFAHPAKFSRGLIRHIIEHAMEEGWLKRGDTVIDPFGGVALGALYAMTERLNWVGMELEERFVLMGNRNIQRWESLYHAGGYEHGSAYLYHGDSRYLGLLLDRRANGLVSSPPYADGCAHTGGNDPHPEHIQGGTFHGVGIQGAISSPPYAQSINANDQANDVGARRDRQVAAGIDITKSTHRGGPNSVLNQPQVYGNSPAQLGAMKEGEFQAAVSSPPYNLPMSQDHSGRGGGKRGTTPSEPGAFIVYGNSPGQIEGLPMGDFEACVSSPPYETSRTDSEFQRQAANPDVDLSMPESTKGYGAAGLGRDRTQAAADTFWSASRQVIEQVYQVLAPGAHAIWVCKDFVRKGERVPFTHRWAELCVACGFEWLHEHRAWLTESYGTQLGFFGDKPIVKERKSFFRRLAEKNGAPHIDWESVLCFRKV